MPAQSGERDGKREDPRRKPKMPAKARRVTDTKISTLLALITELVVQARQLRKLW